MTEPIASTAAAKESGPQHLAPRRAHERPRDPAGRRWSSLNAPRPIASAASLLVLLVGVVAGVVHAELIRTWALLAYCVVGVGSAPWQLRADLRVHIRVVLSGLTAIAVATAVSMLMLAFGQWWPLASFAVIAAISAALHLLVLRRAVLGIGDRSAHRAPPRAGRRRWWQEKLVTRSHVPALSAGTGALLCLVSALSHRRTGAPFGGFPADIGPLWYAGLGLVLLGLVVAAVDDSPSIAVAVIVLALVLAVTPVLVYYGPRSQSAAKHVDLILQIRTLHELRSSVGVYNAWPGFFSATAWWSDVAGIRDPLNLASAWPALLAPLRIAALRFFAGQVLSSNRLIWVAVALAVLADTIGADYFSPQSVGFVLGVIAYGLALSRPAELPARSLLLLVGCLVTVTHQLSPYVVGGTIVVLVVLRQARPWWTPTLVLGPALLWSLLHRTALAPFLSFGALGDPANFRPPRTVGSEQLERLPIVSVTVVALLVCIGVIGLLALWTLIRTRRTLRSWSFAAAPAVGLVLVAANPYGQEGIFRAVLFGIPWLAVLAAPAVVALIGRGRAGRPGAAALTGVLAVLTAANLVASFGLDRLTVVRPGDVTVLARLAQEEDSATAETAVVLLGTGNLPSAVPQEGWNGVIVGQLELDEPVQQLPPQQVPGQAQRITDAVLRRLPATADVFAVWSPTLQDYAWTYAVQSPEQSAALRDGLLASASWDVVAEQDGAYLFHLDRNAG